jgi:type IV pilus assembly protein PilY1
MNNIFSRAQPSSLLNVYQSFKYRWLALGALCLAGAVSLVAVGQVSPPNIPATNLSSDPLFAAAGGDKPAMALALSVEFPTVGAQYVAAPGATTDATYANTKEYLGYYDAESCYNYNTTPTETPALGQTVADYKRFDRTGPATNRSCADAFSGNFLNWSTNSAIDMLRLALSGGDRYIDTPSLTVLQRAVIPNGDPICMWNSGNFPAKQLQKDGGGAGTYWGAVPLKMRAEAVGNDIWVGNTLNRIYFGKVRGGSCTSTSSYSLGTPPPATSTVLGKTYGPGASPLGYPTIVSCANGAACGTSGLNEILFGRASEPTKWVSYATSGPLTCNAANFPGGSTNGGAQCYLRPYIGPLAPPAAPVPLTNDSFFYSRVSVCDSTAGTLNDNRDYKLCTRYPNGSYKPTGSIQKYSDQLRLSAFGYVMEQTASYNAGRYGGVLRAPMKFVGAKTFDITGQENTPATGNPNAEWDSTTGVFAANPDNDVTQTTPISGVINYLNKFGRTGPVPGRYKKFDPVGELHYETLRYLQGLQPSAAAIAGLTIPTSDLFDGFPVSTVWTDPYGGGRTNTADYSCLKSNIVVIGDVNTHDGNRLPAASASGNIPDINYWRSVASKFESNANSTYPDGLYPPVTRQTGNPNTPNASMPTGSQTSQIIGSAYWSHTHDIRGQDWSQTLLRRPGLRTKTFLFDVNENASSNDVNYRQKQNQFFMASKYGGFESDDRNTGGKPFNAYGNPFKRQDGTNDNNVWQDPLNPGEASTYYLQSNARGVLNAFDSIFSRASTSARSIAGSAVASKSLSAGTTLIYQSSFDTSDWTGDVLAYSLTAVGASGVNLGASPTWTAETRLQALTAPASSRKIIVGKPGATASPNATAFLWTDIDSTLQTALNKASPTATPDGLGADRLNYLRGDKSKEGNPFRTRTKLLGDIVNSGVVYSGAPIAPSGAGSTFAGFKASNASRTPAVFVGANDGMLHAFNATTGDELFGYIPSWMSTKLSALTSPTYNGNHQAYVDASPAVAEAQVGSTGTSADWKTVLVSGTGGGGSGVFALDVSNPSLFSASKVLWEFTRADDPDMGYVVGRPYIVKIRTSSPGATVTYRWFAAVPSGVNNYVPDISGLFSTTGSPALFLLALDKPAGTAWNASGANPNYYKISLPTDTLLKVTNATGLVNFKPAFGDAGSMETAYMGDLHGRLWKLDFTLRGSVDWNINKLSAYNKGTAASPVPYPLFIAKSGTVIQPITMAPLLAAGPIVDGLKTTIVGFGTGKYLETADKTSTGQNSFYALYDDGTTKADTIPASASAISGRGRLQQGTVDSTAQTVTFPTFRMGRPATDGDSTKRAGWYFDFPTSGERMISPGSIIGNFFILSSLTPASSGAAGSCTVAGGTGSGYRLNIDSGSGFYQKSSVGLLGETLIIDVSSATSKSDSTGGRTKTTQQRSISIGSQGVKVNDSGPLDPSGAGGPPERMGRLSWRQISNYLDLKKAP